MIVVSFVFLMIREREEPSANVSPQSSVRHPASLGKPSGEHKPRVDEAAARDSAAPPSAGVGAAHGVQEGGETPDVEALVKA